MPPVISLTVQNIFGRFGANSLKLLQKYSNNCHPCLVTPIILWMCRQRDGVFVFVCKSTKTVFILLKPPATTTSTPLLLGYFSILRHTFCETKSLSKDNNHNVKSSVSSITLQLSFSELKSATEGVITNFTPCCKRRICEETTWRSFFHWRLTGLEISIPSRFGIMDQICK